MTRWLLIILGWLAVVLATLGVVLPLLPTTPFLLLAAWCFARSSPRFHHWLLYRSWFGSYLRHWQQHKALPPGAKWKAVLVIVVTFAASLLVGEPLVGARCTAGDPGYFADLYAPAASY
ncbi:Inner membrane protein ybaN [Serratia fonticola]|uniref:Inner membrane protein ybaN n=1 Tax=Serratia fonticola TaxID=47917 RepID=A0A4U9VM99_SERFO|nr:Inner membrane protein ybaN [Serratia fonticola]